MTELVEYISELVSNVQENHKDAIVQEKTANDNKFRCEGAMEVLLKISNKIEELGKKDEEIASEESTSSPISEKVEEQSEGE